MRFPQAFGASLLLALALAGNARAALRVVEVQQDQGGMWTCSVLSDFLGQQPTVVRIVRPTNPARAKTRRFLYVLPVEAGVTGLQSRYGDGLDEGRRLDLHNRYNITLVAPSFPDEPWYGDHASDPTRRHESFLIYDLIPWVDRWAAPCRPAERWLIGFSKSGNGALHLIFRHPGIFAAAAAWDAPAQLGDLSRFAGQRETFGTEENFSHYHVPRLVAEWGASFRTHKRLWISGDRSAWTKDMETLHDQMRAANVLHEYVAGAAREHHWSSGWLEGAVAFLHTTQSITSEASDTGFACGNRASRRAGLNWRCRKSRIVVAGRRNCR